jgi:hypothetical protein
VLFTQYLAGRDGSIDENIKDESVDKLFHTSLAEMQILKMYLLMSFFTLR